MSWWGKPYKGNKIVSFYVKKIVWEYGEKFGDVFYPNNILDLKEKIKELDSLGKKDSYPFFIFIDFNEDDLSLSFSIGDKHSCMEFVYKSKEKNNRANYLYNTDGDINVDFEFSYFSSYSITNMMRTFPQEKVLEAIYYFIENKIFPSFINFEDEETNEQWVLKSSEKEDL